MMTKQLGNHAQPYEMLAAHIDERYRVTYGNTKFHAPKDDPIGVFALLGDERPEPAADLQIQQPQGQQQDYSDRHLDAFSKSKGKGWMANGGRCNACSVEGHMARDCPSQKGANGKASGTDECFGCRGERHRTDECPYCKSATRGVGAARWSRQHS